MGYQHLAAYRFTPLSNLANYQLILRKLCQQHALKGTIYLATEGINLNLAGAKEDTQSFLQQWAEQIVELANLTFKLSALEFIPFGKLCVKIKKEIITSGADYKAWQKKYYLSPKALLSALQAGAPLQLLDVRNHYETRLGHFDNAICFPINTFTEFPQALQNAKLAKDKPAVIYCTGGIRCEKAASVLIDAGFAHVYQLAGGILGYFAECGGKHYQGDCFVFDDRVLVTPQQANSTRVGE